MSVLGGLRRSLTGVAPVGFAVMLAAFCAAGTELYVSATGSAATQEQLAEACPSTTALTLEVPRDNDLPHDEGTEVVPGTAAAIAEQIAANMPLVEPPRHGGGVRVQTPSASGVPARVRLVQLEGLTNGDEPMPELGPGEVAITAFNAEQLGVQLGSVMPTEYQPFRTGFEPPPLAAAGPDLTVAYVIPDVPATPVPDAWCGIAELVQPTLAGDAPPLSAIISADTLAMFDNGYLTTLEMQVVNRPLTLTELRTVVQGYRTATAQWSAVLGYELSPENSLGLRQVTQRATGVAATVDRSLEPVRLTSLVAIAGVLLATAVLLARERRRELRLLGIRGVTPMRVAARMLPSVGITAVVAAALGCALAWGVVVALAPSGLLEPAALLRAWLLAAAVAVVSTAAVFGALTVAANHVVDRAAHRSIARFALPFVAVALGALALAAYRTLEDKGGIRTFGVEVRGGELLALGFPLFALLAGTVIAGTVVGPAATLARRTGGRLPRAVRLGWRRVVLEAGPTVATVAAVSLAAGSFVAASALSDGSNRQLVDKAAVYVGSDLAVTVFDTPALRADVLARSTTVVIAGGKVDGTTVDVYGIDPDTFSAAARLRSDGASRSLSELVESLTATRPAGSAPVAIAVGPDRAVGDMLEITLAGVAEPLVVEVVATAKFFPGKATGITELVMLDEVVTAATPLAVDQLLVRDPPEGLVQSIRDQGVRVGVVLDAATTFDASSFSGLRWAYLPLRILGLLFAIVAAAVQFLVVAARRVPRRAAHAIQQRTGFGKRSLWTAALTEAFVPLAVGAGLGLGLGLWAVKVAVPLLDPMPLLAPRAAFAMPWPTVLGILLAVPLWALVTAALIVRSTTSGDSMRALRGEQ